MISPSLGKKQYALLGRLLTQKNPELANDYFTTYLEGSPIETDLSHETLAGYFIAFCHIQDIKNPEQYQGAIHKTSMVDVRRTFIGVVLHLYCPQVYNQPIEHLNIQRGMVKNLSFLFKMEPINVSRMIREVVTMDRVYEGFKEKVTSIVESFNPKAA